MSELITTTPAHENFHRHLLNTASALAVLAGVTMASPATAAEDDSRPTVWIELGAQVERLSPAQEAFLPEVFANSPRASVWNVGPLDAQRSPRYGIGGEAKITIAPEGSDWVVSAGLRYGRANRNKEVQQQSNVPTLVPNPVVGHPVPPLLKLANLFGSDHSSSYAIADFKAGKDVGLGLFGGHAVLSGGLRYAQFSTKSNITLKSRPDLGEIEVGQQFNIIKYHPYVYQAAAHAQRSFQGIGPSLNWEGSSPLAGHPDQTQVSFDWGVNAALLFGRQKAKANHQTHVTQFYQTAITKYNVLSSRHDGNSTARTRSVVVPNLGGSAGLSLNFPNAKIALGYRADFFFGAMDSGFDRRKNETTVFHGPYAKIAVGL